MIEAVVALLLIGLVLLFSLTTLFAYPRYRARMAASTEAYRIAEAVLETVRSGEIPVIPGTYPLPWVFPPRALDETLEIELRVAEADTSDLYRIVVKVSYTHHDEPREVRLESLAWSPGR